MKKTLSIAIATAFSWGILYSAFQISDSFYIILLFILIGTVFLYWAGAWEGTNFFWKSILVACSITSILSLSESSLITPLWTLFVGFILGVMWCQRQHKDQQEENRRAKEEKRHTKKLFRSKL